MFGLFKKEPPKPAGPDFSGIDSKAKAEALLRKGELEKLYLFPLEMGGAEIEQNMLYVPIGVAGIKSRIDNNVIRPLAAEGKITEYKAEPEYQGRSFIPIAIKITAWNPEQFTSTINIWGEALGRK